jgi:hypothetical protein
VLYQLNYVGNGSPLRSAGDTFIRDTTRCGRYARQGARLSHLSRGIGSVCRVCAILHRRLGA